jgi:glycosyltransferase involved in cell wall biosynthesis
MKNLTLVIPAKNEWLSLPKVLEELKKYKFKIIIVLHRTDKKTIRSIKKFNYKIIKQNSNGYGNAIIQGINSVKTKYLCIFNADGSFNPKDLFLMLKKIKSKYHFAFASRYLKGGGSDDDTIVTFIGNKIFTFIGKFFFKSKWTGEEYETFDIISQDEKWLLDIIPKASDIKINKANIEKIKAEIKANKQSESFLKFRNIDNVIKFISVYKETCLACFNEELQVEFVWQDIMSNPSTRIPNDPYYISLLKPIKLPEYLTKEEYTDLLRICMLKDLIPFNVSKSTLKCWKLDRDRKSLRQITVYLFCKPEQIISFIKKLNNFKI